MKNRPSSYNDFLILMRKDPQLNEDMKDFLGDFSFIIQEDKPRMYYVENEDFLTQDYLDQLELL